MLAETPVVSETYLHPLRSYVCRMWTFSRKTLQGSLLNSGGTDCETRQSHKRTVLTVRLLMVGFQQVS